MQSCIYCKFYQRLFILQFILRMNNLWFYQLQVLFSPILAMGQGYKGNIITSTTRQFHILISPSMYTHQAGLAFGHINWMCMIKNACFSALPVMDNCQSISAACSSDLCSEGCHQWVVDQALLLRPPTRWLLWHIVTPTTMLAWWVTIEMPVTVEHGWLSPHMAITHGSLVSVLHIIVVDEVIIYVISYLQYTTHRSIFNFNVTSA